MTSKPGWQTTEFWLSLGAMLLGAALSSGILDAVSETHVVTKLVGAAVVVLTALGYDVARTMTKRNE